MEEWRSYDPPREPYDQEADQEALFSTLKMFLVDYANLETC